MFKIIVYALAAFAVYILFFKDKIITIGPKAKPQNKSRFTEYEDLDK